jgi:hypothetical protein
MLLLAYALGRAGAVAIAGYFVVSRFLTDRLLHGDASLILYVFDLFSTPAARMALAGAYTAVLCVGVWLLRKRRSWAGNLALFALGISVVFVATPLLDQGAAPLILCGGVLATNLLLEPALHRWLPRVRHVLSVAGAGLVEVLVALAYWDWVRSLLVGRRVTSNSFSVGARSLSVVLAALTLAFSVDGAGLIDFERYFRFSPHAAIVDRGNFNGIQLDVTGRFLYVSGHGVPRLRRYDVEAWNLPPLEGAHVDDAQGFAYDPAAGEIYVFNTGTRALMFLDANTLLEKHSVVLDELSYGDPWVVADAVTNTVAIVSENDGMRGTPFVVMDRTSRQVVARLDAAPGNVVKHPARPWIYMSFFRDSQEIAVYDLAVGQMIRRRPTVPHTDRLALSADGGEVFLAAPLRSAVLRFDSMSLEPRGQFPAGFGVRTIAMDADRGLLFTGSIATGVLHVSRLSTGETIERHYLGPWLRTIEADRKRRQLYVSSNGALYALSYAHLD